MAKYNPKADKFRADGNDLFRKSKFCEALLAYNHSLCYAETGTEAVALAYGNRSAVYFCLEEYELCIQNIKLAKDNNYPVGKIQKLYERQTNAEVLLVEKGPKPKDDRVRFFKMRYPPNPKHPNLSECIELKEDAKFGKHLITNKDLKPGDVIALVEPTLTVFDKRARLHHCSNCNKNSMLLSLIPCTRCAKAMYCSEECRDTHLEKFHQFECPVANSRIENEVMRMLCELLFNFDWNVDLMKQFFDENEGQGTIFDFDLSDTTDRHKNLLFAMMKSELKTKELNSWDLTAHFACLIQKHPKLQSIFTSQRNKTFLNSLVRKLVWILTIMLSAMFETNIDMTLKETVDFDELLLYTRSPTVKKFGNVTYRYTDPYQQFLKHSCVPSVMITSFDDKAVWTVYSPMSAGERLTVNHAPPRLIRATKLERQKYFKKFLNCEFEKCKCDACLYDWKFYNDKSVSNLLDFFKHQQLTKYLSKGICNTRKDEHARIALEAIDKLPLLHAHLPNVDYWGYIAALEKSFSLLAVPRLFMISAPEK